MFDLSRQTRGLVSGGEAGMQRRREFSLLDTQENRVEPGFGADPEASDEQLEMLERIRVAAGQTS